MPTFEENIYSRTQRWSAIVRIEGVGASLTSSQLEALGDDARYCFCSSVPDYADTAAGVWWDYLAEMPELMSERGNLWGGFPDLGELAWSMLDYGGRLGAVLATDLPPTTAINEELNATDTTITVLSSSAIPPSSVIWVGSEAMHVTAIVDSTTITVTRGYLSTDATAHALRDRVFTTCNFLKRRRVDLYLVPTDGSTRADETLVGQYVIDTGPTWSVSEDGAGLWRFAARSQSQYLARVAPSVNRQAQAVEISEYGLSVEISEDSGRAFFAQFRQWDGVQDDGSASIYLQHERGEVIAIGGPRRAMSQANGGRITRRDVLGSGMNEISPGDIFTQVMCAEHTAPDSGGCSFRVSDPASTSDAASPRSTWRNTANPIDVLLCIMTSSASSDDGLWFNNYQAGKPNWSCLPAGYGLGIPASKIDVDQWIEAIQKTQHISLPALVYGSKPEPFAAWAAREILIPLGAYVYSSDGLIKIALPGLPLANSATVTIGADNVIQREIAPRQYLPAIEISRGTHDDTSTIEYKIGPKPARSITVSCADSSEMFSARRTYGISDQPKTIAVSGGDRSRAHEYGRALAEPHLWRIHRPAYNIELEYDLSLWSAKIGDAVAVTLDGMPNQASYARGWTSLQCEVMEREPVIDEDGPRIRARLVGFTQSANYARVTSAAHIVSHSTDSGTGEEVIVTTANKMTQSDAAGLPTTDAAAFTVGDKVRIMNAAGTLASGSTIQEITEISGTTIKIDGDFGSLSMAGKILVFADYDNASAAQTSSYAFFSDLTNATVGASPASPYIFGRG